MDKVALAPGVRMLSVSRVTPVPPPVENVKVKLSLLDAPWVATPPVQQVFLYETVAGHEFAAAVKRLKESLAAALALYLPLAGNLDYVEESRDLVVDCSQSGVTFFKAEAEAGGAAVAGGCMEVASLLPQHDARVLPTPVMAVQATRLNAGMALGVSVHHAAVDGRSVVLFLEAWTSIARAGSYTSPAAVIKSLAPPHYAREAITVSHPGSDELAGDVLSKMAPKLPLANTTECYFGQHTWLARQTLILGADDIQALKRRIDGLAPLSSGSTAELGKPVSKFVALSALCWTAFVQAKHLAAGDDTHLLFQVDLRARLRPPVGARYVGNCVRGCIASADAGELLGEAGLLRASRAIQAAVEEVVAAPLARVGAWVERIKGLPVARQVVVAGSPLFHMHHLADFGFGMPDTVVLPASMTGSPDTPVGGAADHGSSPEDHGGRMVLSGGKRHGEVHLSVSLQPELMNAFKNHIHTIPIRSKF